MTKKIEKTMDETKIEDDRIVIFFGEDGIGVKGSASESQYVSGILALISSLIKQTGGDDSAFRSAIKAIRDKDVEKEDIHIGKLDLNDKEGVEKFIELLKKASSK